MEVHLAATGEEAVRLAMTQPRHLRGAGRCSDAAHGRLGSSSVELRRVTPELPVVLVTADRLLSIRGSVRDKPVSGDEIDALVRTSCAHAGRSESKTDDAAAPRRTEGRPAAQGCAAAGPG